MEKSQTAGCGKLYIVPTPVGNLEDMTLRAIRVLKEADLILAEDTRTSSVLLKHYEIHRPLQSHHKFNEHQTVRLVKERILGGLNVALISDAGTPGISDPGFLLTRTCAEEGIEVQTLPGATACIPAIVSSGLPCDRFAFEGFLPRKKADRPCCRPFPRSLAPWCSMSLPTGWSRHWNNWPSTLGQTVPAPSPGRFPKCTRSTTGAPWRR